MLDLEADCQEVLDELFDEHVLRFNLTAFWVEHPRDRLCDLSTASAADNAAGTTEDQAKVRRILLLLFDERSRKLKPDKETRASW